VPKGSETTQLFHPFSLAGLNSRKIKLTQFFMDLTEARRRQGPQIGVDIKSTRQFCFLFQL
jgi:hypothetical protein